MKTLEDNSSARLIFVHVLMSREKESEADRGKKISQVRFTFFTGKNGRVLITKQSKLKDKKLFDILVARLYTERYENCLLLS